MILGCSITGAVSDWIPIDGWPEFATFTPAFDTDAFACADESSSSECAWAERVAIELASCLYCEGCHESFPDPDGLGGDGLCQPCYDGRGCDWEQGCGGTGVVHCRGCGGDQCICKCGGGGEAECDGCEDCKVDDVSGPEDDGYDSDYSDD
jgi:hypothetical protein